jgi:hypothetical protein
MVATTDELVPGADARAVDEGRHARRRHNRLPGVTRR